MREEAAATGSEREPGQVRRIVRDIAFLSTSRYVGFVGGVVRSLLIPRYVVPGFYGVLKTFQTFSELSRVGTLGIQSALFRELPIAIARQDEKRRMSVLDNGFLSGVLSAAPLALAFLVGGLAGWIRFQDVAVSWWFVLFVPLLLVDRTRIFFDVVYAGQKQFVLQAKIRLIDEFVTTGLCVAGAYLFGAEGLLTMMLVTNVLVVALLWRGSRYRFRGMGDLPLAREMAVLGFPHLLNGLGNTVYSQIDRMVILGAYGVTAVGFYSVGMTLADQMISAALVMSRVLMPRMMESYGTTGDVRELHRFVIVPSRLAAAAFAPIVALGWILCEPVFAFLLPKYEPGLLPARIQLVGVFFLVIWATLSQFFLAIKKQWRLTMIFLLTIPAVLGLTLGAVNLGLELPGIALATTLMDFGFATSVLLMALGEFHASAWRRLAETARVYAPLIPAVAVMGVSHEVRALAGLAHDPLRGPAVEAATFLLVYVVPMALLLLSARGRRLLGFEEFHG